MQSSMSSNVRRQPSQIQNTMRIVRNLLQRVNQVRSPKNAFSAWQRLKTIYTTSGLSPKQKAQVKSVMNRYKGMLYPVTRSSPQTRNSFQVPNYQSQNFQQALYRVSRMQKEVFKNETIENVQKKIQNLNTILRTYSQPLHQKQKGRIERLRKAYQNKLLKKQGRTVPIQPAQNMTRYNTASSSRLSKFRNVIHQGVARSHIQKQNVGPRILPTQQIRNNQRYDRQYNGQRNERRVRFDVPENARRNQIANFNNLRYNRLTLNQNQNRVHTNFLKRHWRNPYAQYYKTKTNIRPEFMPLWKRPFSSFIIQQQASTDRALFQKLVEISDYIQNFYEKWTPLSAEYQELQTRLYHITKSNRPEQFQQKTRSMEGLRNTFRQYEQRISQIRSKLRPWIEWGTELAVRSSQFYRIFMYRNMEWTQEARYRIEQVREFPLWASKTIDPLVHRKSMNRSKW